MVEDKVRISDLHESSFRFSLQGKFREEMFIALKKKHKTWKEVAKRLETNKRNLFGMRRGWDKRGDRHQEHPIQAKWLLKIKEELHLSDEKLEENITRIKHGNTGAEGNINLPLKIDRNKRRDTIESALYDYKEAQELQQKIKEDLPTHMERREEYVTINVHLKPQTLERLHKQGLAPSLRDDKKTLFVGYVIPKTRKRKEVKIPKEVRVDEKFAKELGKWLGDRCGGRGKVGVANKDWIFVHEFAIFLKDTLRQENVDIYGTYREEGKISDELMRRVKKMKLAKTQKGDYAFRAEVSNTLLRYNLFDICEEHLVPLLTNSRQSVRHAFYAGYFEADGSTEKKSKRCSFAFGFDINKDEEARKNVLKRAVQLKYLLEKDDMKARISRKCAHTEKSQVLKYDVDIVSKRKEGEVRFIKALLPFMTHPDKLKRMEEDLQEMMKTIKKSEVKQMVLQQPVLNIGTVGQ